MIQYDRQKMRAVVLRTCHACRPADLGAVKLHKVLYYLDMMMYAHQRQAVTGATYLKRPNGPMASELLAALRDMERDGDIRVDTVNYHGFLKKEYYALTDEPQDILNTEEQSMLDDVIDFVCRKNTAKSISDYSHALPWEMAELGGVIPYHSAMLLFPMQPTAEAFDLVEKGMAEIETARSQSNAVGMQDITTFRSSVLSAVGQR